MERSGAAAAERSMVFDDLATLEALIDDPANRDAILQRDAKYSAAFLAFYLHPPSSEEEPSWRAAFKAPLLVEMDKASEAMLYDSALPTIVIDTGGSFTGSELVAVAAQRRRVAGKPSCNVVLMPSSTDCGRIIEYGGKTTMEATHGILVGHTGIFVARGELTRPVRADLVETTNRCFLEQCKEAGIPTMNDPDLAAQHNAKQLEALAQIPGVHLPTRLAPAAIWREDTSGSYVVKPSKGSQGRGVRMFEHEGMRDEALTYYDFLASHDYEPVVEQRVRSWPLHRPVQTAELDTAREQSSARERLDWNVRALIGGGKLIGMYVRADRWGKPINKAAGAEAVALRDLEQYVESPAVATMLIEKLTTAGEALAAHIPTGIAGADLTIDESGKAYLYEINVGNTGGLQTLAELEESEDLDQKLAAADRLLEAWMDAYGLRPKSLPSKRSVGTILRWLSLEDFSYSKSLPRLHRLRRDLSHLHIGSMSLDPGEVGKLSEATMRELDPTPLEWAWWHRSKCAADTPDKEAAEQAFAAAVPLEFVGYLGSLVDEGPYPARLLPYIDHFEPLLPDPVAWDTLRSVIFMKHWAIGKVRAALYHSIDQGAPAEPMRTTFIEAVTSMREDYYRETSGFRRTDSDPDYDLGPLRSIYAAYLDRETGLATTLLEAYLADVDEDDEMALTLGALAGLEIALAEQDSAACARYIGQLTEMNYDVAADEVLEYFVRTAAGNAEAIALCIASYAQSNSLISALETYAQLGPTCTPTGRESLAKLLANSFGALYDETEQAPALAAHLQQFINNETGAEMPGPGTLQRICRVLRSSEITTEEVICLQQEIFNDPNLSSVDQEALAAAVAEGVSEFLTAGAPKSAAAGFAS